ncbi:MAG: FHA domain-containing protein, partial [Pseudanabaena sp.]
MQELLHHMLTVEDPKGLRNFLLQNMTYSLGRSLDNLIVLRSNLVSRQHATILAVTTPKRNSYLFRIIDGNLDGIRSTNGVLINGRKRFSHILSHGDEILFSKDTKAVYQVISSLSLNPKSRTLQSNPLNENILSDQGLNIIDSIKCSPLISIADSDLSVHIRETINQFIASPELNPQPIIELNLDGKILYLNPAALYQFPEIN